MLHSTYLHKDTYEDPKTSAVFENLMLLPDNVFWYILRQSCFNNKDMPEYSGRLLCYKFWPHWNSKGTNNSKYVEPDLFLRFEEFDVIIEAKYSSIHGQDQDQWQREIVAYHNEFGNDKSFVFIAVGGNMSTMAETIKFKSEEAQIYKCNWLSLLTNINKYEKDIDNVSVPDMNLSATKRLLNNIILAFNINGVYNIEWFNTMARTRPVISTYTVERIQSRYKW